VKQQIRPRRVNFEDETAYLAISMTKKLPNMRLQRSIELSSMSKSCTDEFTGAYRIIHHIRWLYRL
jgi:hypothetical protein